MRPIRAAFAYALGSGGKKTGSGAQGAAKMPWPYAGWSGRWGCAEGGIKGRARRRQTTRPSEVQETTASSSMYSPWPLVDDGELGACDEADE